MKKRLSVIIALVLALVMSFTLVACGGSKSNKKETPNTSEGFTSEKAIEALDKLANAGTLAARVTLTMSTNNEDPTVITVDLEKHGDKLIVSAPVAGSDEPAAMSILVDASTGVIYRNMGNGWCYVGEVPQGLVGYLAALDLGVEEALPGDAAPDVNFDIDTLLNMLLIYDEDENRLYGSYDASMIINSVLAPVYSAYENKQSLEELINAYLSFIPTQEGEDPLTVSELLDNVVNFIIDDETGIQKYKLSEVLVIIDEKLGLSDDNTIEALLDYMFAEIGLDPAEMHFVLDRTVGEVLEGVFEYATTLMNGSDASTEEMLMNLIEYAFMRPVDVKNLKTNLRLIQGVAYGYLHSTKFNELIDSIDEQSEDTEPALIVIKNIIVNKVQFTELGVNVSVKFDNDYNIEKLELKAGYSHNYKTATELPFLSLNSVKCGLDVSIVSYSEAASDYTISYSEDPNMYYLPESTYVIVCDEDTFDVKVFYEKGAHDVVVSSIEITTEDDKTIAVTKGAITFTDKYFTISRAYINSLDASVFDVEVEFTVDGEEPYYYDMYVVRVPDHTVDALIDTIMSLVAVVPPPVE